MKTHTTLFNTCLLAFTATLCAPALAEGIEPMTDILNTPGWPHAPAARRT